METKARIALTQTVKKGGCAAKLPAGQLKHLLDSLSLRKPPELTVGPDSLDDAALWDLGDGRALVQTLDFFTPIVDDAFDFGAIAATNALSDVYAMGGAPKTALTILAFPMAILDETILTDLMKGAIQKIEESGACLAGGHSIDDDTLKLGFSVTGFVERKKAWLNKGAQRGDALILTKALGTGTICSALKNGSAEPAWIRGAVESMTRLNNAPELLSGIEVHAATDVTGFGLASHSLNVARSSGVTLHISVAKLPTLEGALHCLNQGVLNRAHRTNADYVKDHVHYAASVSESLRYLTLDAQTSGGLLLSVRNDQADETIQRLRARFPQSTQIGEVRERSETAWVHFQ